MDSHSHRPSPPEHPSRVRNVAGSTARDELNDLFNYDAGIDDVFRDVDTNMDITTKIAPRQGKDKSDTGVGLGIEEEIKVSRKRRPVAKLDEARYDPWRNTNPTS